MILAVWSKIEHLNRLKTMLLKHLCLSLQIDRAYILLAFAFFPSVTWGQQLVYADSTYSQAGDLSSNIGFYSSEDCNDVIWGRTFPGHFKDIAIRPDGRIFGYGTNSMQQGLLWAVGVDNLGSGITSYYASVPYDSTITGMVADSLGNLYAAGKGIWKINRFFSASYLGDLPPPMRCRGDITHRFGRFYMATVQHQLVEVDMEDLSNSQVVMDFPPDVLPIHGLTTVHFDCDSAATYAVGKTDTYSKIYLLDFNNFSLIEVCETPRVIMGVASFSESVIPPCKVWVDLDVNNSSGLDSLDFRTNIVCQAPIAIADEDVRLVSSLDAVDSITISLKDIYNANDEYLTSSTNISGITVLGGGTNQLVLINMGTASTTDFENLIKSILYHNTAPNIVFGIRQIDVVAYEKNSISSQATSFVQLINKGVGFDAIVEEIKCYGDNNGQITIEGTDGTSPYTVIWPTGQSNTITDLEAGLYYLTIADAAGCFTQDSLILSQPDSLGLAILNEGPSEVCGNHGNLYGEAIGGSMPYLYEWSNGVNTPENNGIPAGDYLLTATDNHGCQAIDTFTLDRGESVLIDIHEQICEGEKYWFAGQAYGRDTSFCLTHVLENGCDSVVCLNLLVHEQYSSEELITTCRGDTISLMGIMVQSDTSFCFTEQSINGCDSTYCINVAFSSPVITFEVSGSLCNEGTVIISGGDHDVYQWSTGEDSPSIDVNAPGDYSLTVTDDIGCTSEDYVTLTGENLNTQISSVDPLCFGDANGEIEVMATGGTPPYFYSINGTTFQAQSLFTGLSAGTYIITVKDSDDCIEQFSAVLENPVPIMVSAGDDLNTKLGEEVRLSVNTNIINPSIQWTPVTGLSCTSCFTPSLTALETTSYQIIIRDDNGCYGKDTITLFVDKYAGIFIPNVFTPNGDGINDYLTVYSDASVAMIESLQIYSRWGTLVFEARNIAPNEPELGWDGNFNGKPMNQEVFVYHVVYVLTNNGTNTIHGDLMLLR